MSERKSLVEESPELWGPVLARVGQPIQDRTCGRPTAAGGSCAKEFVRSDPYGMFIPGVSGCHWHLTDEERELIVDWKRARRRELFADLAPQGTTVESSEP